jgi:hypothetical protein
MDFWKKQSIDDFINNLRNYYNDCSVTNVKGQGIIEKLNIEEQSYLNDNLNLCEIVGVDKDQILLNSLKDKSKDNFSFFILQSKAIHVEINALDKNGNTVFMRLIKKCFWDKKANYTEYFKILFERNYTIKKEDIDFVTSQYKEIKTPLQFEKWTLLRFFVKINDKEKVEFVIQKKRELFVIVSLKLNKSIGFNYPNLLGVMNLAFQYYRENGSIFLKAIEKYDRTNDLKILDKKGSFNSKILEYNRIKPIQDLEFEELVIILFPELK